MTDTQRNPHRRWAAELLANTGKKLFGMDEVVCLCIVAYCAGGHVLLEGNPGLGKTTLVKELAKGIKLQDGRIQFTPDLMPSDITGTFTPRLAEGRADKWGFEPGPIFASLLLADEINRAAPKTQSAMLEAMAESQVTVLGQTFKLPQPFVVMATQNPIDHAGTYQLPEAQADRFMFKLIMPTPTANTVLNIIANPEPPRDSTKEDQSDGSRQQNSSTSTTPRQALFATFNGHTREAQYPVDESFRAGYQQASKISAIRAAVIEAAPLVPGVKQHIVNMILASNGRFNEVTGLAGEQLSRAKSIFGMLTYGLGPRAAINLARAARAWALCFGTSNTFVQTQVKISSIGEENKVFTTEAPTADAVDLAHVIIPVLRHRLKLAVDWEARYEELVRRAPFAQASDRGAALIADFALATAPTGQKDIGNYRELLRANLEQVPALKGEQR